MSTLSSQHFQQSFLISSYYEFFSSILRLFLATFLTSCITINFGTSVLPFTKQKKLITWHLTHFGMLKSTRTTRTPAFSPATSWLPTLLSHIGSHVNLIAEILEKIYNTPSNGSDYLCLDLELKALQSGHDFQIQGRRYRSRSKIITCDTLSHASDHLYQIWKESIKNCRCYRVDTIFKAK